MWKGSDSTSSNSLGIPLFIVQVGLFNERVRTLAFLGCACLFRCEGPEDERGVLGQALARDSKLLVTCTGARAGIQTCPRRGMYAEGEGTKTGSELTAETGSILANLPEMFDNLACLRDCGSGGPSWGCGSSSCPGTLQPLRCCAFRTAVASS